METSAAALASRDRPVVDSTHLAALIHVVVWVLLAITTLSLIFRLLTRHYLRESRNFGVEDAMIVLSYLFGLGQTIAVLAPQSAVFGNPISEADSASLEKAVKAKYASDILFVASLFFAKLSICMSFLMLSPFEHKRKNYAIGIAVLTWALSSMLALAFQCSLPQPWNFISGRCIGRAAISYYVAITNIVTDVTLIAFPVFILMPLQMPWKKRLAVISLFFVRISTIAATVAQLAYIHRQFEDDFTFKLFPYIICTQVVQCTSISAACVAYIWPFLKSLQSGLIWADDTAPASRHPTVRSSKWRSKPDHSAGRSQIGNRRPYIELTVQHTVESKPAETVVHDGSVTDNVHDYKKRWV